MKAPRAREEPPSAVPPAAGRRPGALIPWSPSGIRGRWPMTRRAGADRKASATDDAVSHVS